VKDPITVFLTGFLAGLIVAIAIFTTITGQGL
jgi:hypothetical protein